MILSGFAGQTYLDCRANLVYGPEFEPYDLISYKLSCEAFFSPFCFGGFLAKKISQRLLLFILSFALNLGLFFVL